MNVDKIEKNMQRITRLLKVMANEKRLIIVCALHKGEKNVGELEKISGLSQSALSQHLARLRADDIVNTRREAQTIYYSIKDKAADILMHALCDITES